MAGWGDDPILEELRTLIEEGWEVVSIEEDVDTDDGPADRVVIRPAEDGEIQVPLGGGDGGLDGHGLNRFR